MGGLENKIGLGSAQFGLDYGISNQKGRTSIKEVNEILDLASDCVKVVDTASAYGISEMVLGKLHFERFQIVSKFMPSQSGVTIFLQLMESLSRLKTGSLYGYLAHRPLDLTKKDWRELQELKIKGKITKIGYSLNSPSEYENLKMNGFEPDIVQVPYNYFDRRFEQVLQELKSKGCEIHARSTFLQGLFFINPDDLPSFFDRLKPELIRLRQIYGEDLPKVLLRFVLKKDFIDYVIIGVENRKQLKNNIENLDSVPDLMPVFMDYPEEAIMPVNWPNF